MPAQKQHYIVVKINIICSLSTNVIQIHQVTVKISLWGHESMGEMKGDLWTQVYSLWKIIFPALPQAPTSSNKLQSACAVTQLDRFLFW